MGEDQEQQVDEADEVDRGAESEVDEAHETSDPAGGGGLGTIKKGKRKLTVFQFEDSTECDS